MADWEAGEIKPNKNGVLQVQKKRRRGFTHARKRVFLEQLATTCNVTASAKAAGVSLPTVYDHRSKDAAFRAAWIVAQENSYAALEADLVRRSRELLDSAVPQDGSAIGGMDAKLAFALLQNFQKKSGREPGDMVPRKSDLAEATRRLEKVMARMKLLPRPDSDGTDEE